MTRKISEILLCATIGFPACVLAQTTSQAVVTSMPYAMMYNLAQKQATGLNKYVAGPTNYVLIIKSKLPGVKPKDISLYINSNTGRVPLVVDEVGFFQFPVSGALIAENPPVIANQPKGSMFLGVDTRPAERPPLAGGSTNSVEARLKVVFVKMRPLIDPVLTESEFVSGMAAAMKQADSSELFLRIYETAAATCERFAPKRTLTTKQIFIADAILLEGADAKHASEIVDRFDPVGKDGLSPSEIDALYKMTSEELTKHGLRRMSPPDRGIEWNQASTEQQK